MLRSDFFWLVPAIILAFIQVRFIWKKLPSYKENDTEMKGEYDNQKKASLGYLTYMAYIIFILQLPFHVFPVSTNQVIISILRIMGYLLICAGFSVSYAALKSLGNNWTGMFDYRIKKKQILVTSGIYKLIRHPIYFSTMIEIAGFELVANSWLFIILFLITFIVVSIHINYEESLLEEKFHEEFIRYEDKTKKLIPFIY